MSNLDLSMRSTMPSLRSAVFSAVSRDGASAQSQGFAARSLSFTACLNMACSVAATSLTVVPLSGLPDTLSPASSFEYTSSSTDGVTSSSRAPSRCSRAFFSRSRELRHVPWDFCSRRAASHMSAYSPNVTPDFGTTSPRSISAMNSRSAVLASVQVPWNARVMVRYFPVARSRPTDTRSCQLRHLDLGTPLSSCTIVPLPLTLGIGHHGV